MSLLAKRMWTRSENNCLTFGVGELLRRPISLAGRSRSGFLCNRLPDMQVRDGGREDTVKKVGIGRDGQCARAAAKSA